MATEVLRLLPRTSHAPDGLEPMQEAAIAAECRAGMVCRRPFFGGKAESGYVGTAQRGTERSAVTPKETPQH